MSPHACRSSEAIRRHPEAEIETGHRQNFSLDADRILHSLAYSRYIDKTQVFYLIRNDHITHRVLHVQLVSKIGRTIGRLLRLNEDLIEAIALGHDIGHTPFGHDGERFLMDICRIHGVEAFPHNVQSVRFLERIERKGRGLNLTLQVLDGIFCHNGELHSQQLAPDRDKSFASFDAGLRRKTEAASRDTPPMTLEGCVVRMADTISYVGRDIDDAVRLRLIRREDIPGPCRDILGATSGTIVYTLVEDLVAHTLGQPHVRFGGEVGEALRRLKEFNTVHIYNHPKAKRQTYKIRLMFELLFEKFHQDLVRGNEDSVVFREFLDGMSDAYRRDTPLAGIVRDFIVGMTDEYFLDQCHRNLVPQIKTGIA